MLALTRVFLVLLCALSSFAAELRAVTPAGVKPAGPYSPGIRVGNFLYVSGQGPNAADGKAPANDEDQVRQCLRNVGSIVTAGGLTMEHVVYVQVYLTDLQYDAALGRVWKEVFPKAPPARSTIGVAALPGGARVEINAVAFSDLSRRKSFGPSESPVSAAVQAGDRVYISGMSGTDGDPAAEVQGAFDSMAATLKLVGLDFRHMVFVNPYLTDRMPADVMNRIYAKHFEFGNTPARATIHVAGLPQGSNIQFTGVAVMDLAKRQAVRPKNMAPSPTASPCVFADDTFFCSAKSGFIPGAHGGIYASTPEVQLRQTMRNLLDGLEEAGMNFSNVVSSNVYLDNIDDFERFNPVYKEYFGTTPPARTTVQQRAPGNRAANARGIYPTLEQISIIAVK